MLKDVQHLEVREKQYDKKAYVDFFTESSVSTPVVSNVMLYIGTADKKLDENYLGPASLGKIAIQIVRAEGPSGPNREFLFKLENALIQIGCEDKHVMDLANEVRPILVEEHGTPSTSIDPDSATCSIFTSCPISATRCYPTSFSAAKLSRFDMNFYIVWE